VAVTDVTLEQIAADFRDHISMLSGGCVPLLSRTGRVR
jgi:hypothetical protein